MSTQNNNKRNIDPEKVTAERLNGYAALFGCIALVGAYATTGQIIPGFVWSRKSYLTIAEFLNWYLAVVVLPKRVILLNTLVLKFQKIFNLQ